MMPALPKSIIIERLSTNGGETTGSMDTTLKSPPVNLPMRTYTSTYANSRPTSVDRIPTRKPTFSVFVMAWVKVGIWKMRLNTLKLNPPSPTKLSTSSMASG